MNTPDAPNIIAAIATAKRHRIPVRLHQLSHHWIGVVDGDIVHIRNFPRVVDETIARRKYKEAA